MRRTLVILSTSVVALGLMTGSAIAQPAPLPIAIDVAKACGAVTLTFVNPNQNIGSTVGFRYNLVKGEVATGDGARTSTVTVAPGATVKETIRFEEDEFGGVAAVTVAPYFGANGPLNTPLDIYPVDTDCLAPGVTPPVTPPSPPAPTTTVAPPAPTTTGTTTVAPPPAPRVENDNRQNVTINPPSQVTVVPNGAVATGDGSAR